MRAVAAREQAEPAALFAELLQETSVLIRSYRGRAALQRRADAAVAECCFGGGCGFALLKPS